MQLNLPRVKTRVSMSEYTYGKLFLNSLSDQKSVDAAKQLRYAEHYYIKLLGQKSENCSISY